MPKRMSDDEVQNYVYAKLFGDLDHLEANSLFDKEDTGLEDGTAENAVPESSESGGVKITIEPMVKSAVEAGKPTDSRRDGENPDEEEDDEDKLAGISKLSPLMAHLHGDR